MQETAINPDPASEVRWITGDGKTQLLSDLIHAMVVLTVVASASALAAFSHSLPQDVLGTVYGGAIGYAAGRAGNVARQRGGR